MKWRFVAGWLLLATSCSDIQKHDNKIDTAIKPVVAATSFDSSHDVLTPASPIAPQALVDYAKTLIGIPYKYASTDPDVGFDCSGFITYVFNHFNIAVPRSSVEFTNAYPEVAAIDARQGDLILFTGTDSTDGVVGHMGIIVSNINDSISFIHSTSGKAYGVTITPLNEYYKSRFVKVVRVL
jgi:cell wall-associated NlpC family hydrolase